MSSLEKAVFFDRMAEQGLALTYNDLILESNVSAVSPNEVNISGQFSRNIELKTPIVSAAMDTVTTADMAIAMAKLGGLGVIHAGLSIENQAAHVRRVKFHLNGLIEEPVRVHTTQSVESVLNMCHDKGIDFRSFPVVDSRGIFQGMITQNDFDFCHDVSAPVAEIMQPSADIRSALVGTTVQQAYSIMLANKCKALPLVQENGHLGGLYVFSDVERSVTSKSGYNIDKAGRLVVAAAVPTDKEALNRLWLMRKYLDVVVIDSAQGDSKYAFQTLKAIKEEFADLDVVVGNVSNDRSARRLAEAGADGIKIGQGPGSICTTRIETGIGTPQVTATYWCARAVEDLGVPVCADGGIRRPGADISIALAAGAGSVMMGGLLAGTKEAPGELIEQSGGALVKRYRGMGSPSALRESAAARKRYQTTSVTPLSEGIEAFVPYKGRVAEVVGRYILAIRKSFSYVGSKNLVDHQANARFFRVTQASLAESYPHDVIQDNH